MVGWPDAGQHEEMRAADSPRREDDLCLGSGQFFRPAMYIPDGSGPAGRDFDASYQRVRDDREVGPARVRVQVGIGGRPAAPARLGYLVVADAVLLRTVEVVVGR